MGIEYFYNQIAKEKWYQELQDELLKTQQCIINSTDKETRKQMLEMYDQTVLEIHSKTSEKLVRHVLKKCICDTKIDT